MERNKNGIRLHTPGQKIKRKRIKPEYALGQRLFVLEELGDRVEVILPNFSPIIELMQQDGWKEVH